MKAIAAVSLSALASAAAAQPFFVPVNLVPFANERLQSRIPAVPAGATILGSIPFFIDRTLNNVWSGDAAGGPNPRVLEIPINLRGVQEVHTLLNTAWGQPGPDAWVRLEFVGTNGAFFAKDLVGNVEIRDWSQGGFTNSLASADASNVFGVGSTRVDKQRVDLPAAFLTEDLLRVRVVDSGNTTFSRALMQGLTVVVNQPAAKLWRVSQGGNGHTYQAFQVPSGITWDDANRRARTAGGSLATITSADENAFVYSLIGGNQAFWATEANTGAALGPWIGGVQPQGSAEPAGGWSWANGDAFTYANWAQFEPNNANGGTEDRIHFFAANVPAASTWNDYPGTQSTIRGYIVEFVGCPVDFNEDGFLDFFDYDDFVACYEGFACPPGRTADYNGDSFVDFFDYDDFVAAFEAGC
jgi:hypothetical protein